MILLEHYERAVAWGDIQDNPAQRQILLAMQRIIDELQKSKQAWFPRGWYAPQIKGIYLYGTVGAGKTYLMDLFYQLVPEKKKQRFHFHHFMQQIDAQLRLLQGQKNPLERIANNFAKKTRLLCFDEFLVQDVTQAMILAELLPIFFAKKIILVATSNSCPDDLYLHGVQRARFLPVIAEIKQRCEVVKLEAQLDYRLGREPLLTAYFYPLNAATDKKMAEQFAALEPHALSAGHLTIQNRSVAFIQLGERAIWFDFKVICNLPRSQLDYLEIANRFDTVFVSNIPVLTSQDSIYAILLIHFVDVLYDQRIRLILSAAVPLEQLYMQGGAPPAFKRTFSRLQEMQSVDYLTRHNAR